MVSTSSSKLRSMVDIQLVKVMEIFQGSSRPRSRFADLTTGLDFQSKAGTMAQWSWGK